MPKLIEARQHTKLKLILPKEVDDLFVMGLSVSPSNEDLLLADSSNKNIKAFTEKTGRVHIVYSSDWCVYAVYGLKADKRIAILEGSCSTKGMLFVKLRNSLFQIFLPNIFFNISLVLFRS